MLQRGLLALLALAAFALTSALLGRATPLEPFYPTRKLERIQQPGADFDVLFLGSSHVHSGIDPSAFDRRMNEYGCPTHSYNFGIPGMNPPQMSVLADRLLEERPAELETIFAEIYWNLWRRELGNSAEFVYWHDTPGTLAALAAELLTWDDPGYRLRVAGLHLRAFALRTSHARLGYQSLRRRLVEEPSTARQVMLGPIAADDGFRHRAESLPDPAHYAADLRRFATARRAGKVPALRYPGDRVRGWSHQRVVAKLRKQGFEVIPFVFPSGDARIPWVSPESLRTSGTLLLNDPARHPDLYAPEHRRSLDYLNARGAVRLAETLADELAKRRGCSKGSSRALR